jgi:hypothetical protein
VIRLGADSFSIVLCTAAQTLTPSFVGASGDARYADLTAELSSGNGYTKGGQPLTFVTLLRTGAGVAGDTVAWDCANPQWPLLGAGVIHKYAVIYDTTAPNHDLVAMCDMDTGGGSVNPTGSYWLVINNIETLT